MKIPLEALHARRRHDPRRPPDGAAARPLRHRPPARLLHRGRPRSSSSRAPPASSASRSTPTARARSPRRSRGTPRIANRLLRRVRDFAQVRADGAITRGGRPATRSRCSRSTPTASTRSTASCCSRSSRSSAAARSASNALAAAISEEPDAIEDIYEPYLLQIGFLDRTPARPHRHPPRLRALRPAVPAAPARPRRSCSEAMPEPADYRSSLRLRAPARARSPRSRSPSATPRACSSSTARRARSSTAPSATFPTCCARRPPRHEPQPRLPRPPPRPPRRAAAPPRSCSCGASGADLWEALVRPGRRLRPGTVVDDRRRRLRVRIESTPRPAPDGRRRVRLLAAALRRPRAERPSSGSATCRCRPTSAARTAPADRERYQTVYAREPGSVAAPPPACTSRRRSSTRLRARGIERAEVVLHVGPGTFRPVEAEDVREHRVRPRALRRPAAKPPRPSTRARARAAASSPSAPPRPARSRRAPDAEGRLAAGRRRDRPRHRPRLPLPRRRRASSRTSTCPRSSLLLLVCAFAGRERVLAAYAEAVRERLPLLLATATRCCIA